jgi:hypothetical protein
MIKSPFLHQLNCLDLDLHPQCHDVDLVDIGAEWVPPTNKHHVQRRLNISAHYDISNDMFAAFPEDTYQRWHSLSSLSTKAAKGGS